MAVPRRRRLPRRVSLLELWSYLPPLLHRVLLGGFGLALIVSFLPLIRLSLPTRQEALRRLERNAGIKHRPASSYEDRLGATPPKETAALVGRASRAPVGKLIARLKPSWPAPRTDRKDPYAIRAALLLAVVAALLATGGNVLDRLRAAFSPAASSAPALLRLDAWVTPPVYTGLAPIVLADGNETVGAGAESFRALSVPERSELIVRTHAPQGETVSLVTSRDGARGQDHRAEAGRQRRAGRVQRRAERADQRRRQDRRPDRFQMALRPDQGRGADHQSDGQRRPPRRAARCGWCSAPTTITAWRAPRRALRSAKARSATSRRSPAEASAKVEADPLLEPPVMPLQLPRANAKRVDGRATQDLTAHPWAGLKVRMTLVARDQAGQSGREPAL